MAEPSVENLPRRTSATRHLALVALGLEQENRAAKRHQLPAAGAPVHTSLGTIYMISALPAQCRGTLGLLKPTTDCRESRHSQPALSQSTHFHYTPVRRRLYGLGQGPRSACSPWSRLERAPSNDARAVPRRRHSSPQPRFPLLSASL